MIRFIASALLVCALLAPARAQFTLAYTVYGSNGAKYLGSAVAGAGDVNGDGRDDLIVGAPDSAPNGNGSGLARVYSGMNGALLYEVQGLQAGHALGDSVAKVGDLDGDGIADLAAGMPGHSMTGTFAGACRFFSGSDGSVIRTVHGGMGGLRIGSTVRPMGDVDGDGIDDVLVGGTGDPSSGGRAMVFSGADGSVLLSKSGPNGELWGYSMDGVGDLSGDGVPDFVVGVPRFSGSTGFNCGAALVFSGSDGALLMTLEGESNNDELGTSVANAGDVDGDGLNDIIAGAWLDDLNGLTPDAGSATVFSGADGSILYKFWGDAANDEFGRAVASAGDVNADGYADMIVGAPNDDVFGRCGSATVFSGFDGSVLGFFIGDNVNDEFGRAVASAGDVNGDGTDDVIVGAEEDDNFGNATGSARVFLSPSVASTPIGGGQPNSSAATLNVNGIPTGAIPGPFVSPIVRGQYMSLDLKGAPLAFFDVYASYTLNPAGWEFPGFGYFDLGTGPAFGDVFTVMAGFSGPFPFYALDATGSAHLTFFVQPFLAPGVFTNIQAVIQNAQPWPNGIWATITAAHQIVVQ